MKRKAKMMKTGSIIAFKKKNNLFLQITIYVHEYMQYVN